MGTTTTAYAVLLGAAGPAPTSPAAVLAVTVLLLLLLGAVFWSFLRRARRQGVAPLAVDRRSTAPAPTPARPVPPARAAATDVDGAADPETAAAIEDEISEGGPVDGTGERP